MAKKKSSQSQETADTTVTEENLQDKAAEESGENPTDYEAVNPALLMTGIVNLDEVFEDPGVLGRLRSEVLGMTSIYREAQHFAAQNLDVTALMQSREPVLLRNLCEILRILGIWNNSALCALAVNDAGMLASLERYILSSLQYGCTEPASFARDFTAVMKKIESLDLVTPLAIRICQALSKFEQWNLDPAAALQALVTLCSELDFKDLQKLLFDASQIVRVAVLKSLLSKKEVPASFFGLALILYKDGDEKVCTALTRAIAHFTPCAELVIPAMLLMLNTASVALAGEINDAMRGYGDDAVNAVMFSLADTDDGVVNAAKLAISLSPQRYTDPLLRAMKSIRTKDHVRPIVIDILKSHNDEIRREEIMKEVDKYTNPPKFDRPEWVAPAKEVKFLEKACSNDAVYEKLLDDAEVASLKDAFDENTLMRLLNDANVMVQRNAVHIMKANKKASPAAVFALTVWFKSSSLDLATDAIDTYLSYEKNPDAALKTLVESFNHLASDDAKKYCFDCIIKDQALVDSMMTLYYKSPVACSIFIKKFLRNSPSPKTVAAVLAGLDRDKSFNCVEATIAILLDVSFDFDNKKIRKVLLEHVTDPMSRGQRGLILRMDCMKLLSNYLAADKSNDKASISGLQNIYKTIKNSELQKLAKEILCSLDQEVFDLEDEDDDFDDLG